MFHLQCFYMFGVITSYLKIISETNELKCKIKEVKGDWIKIQNGEFKAWVKWKNGSTVFQDCLRFDI